jgi:hypothetical protein
MTSQKKVLVSRDIEGYSLSCRLGNEVLVRYCRGVYVKDWYCALPKAKLSSDSFPNPGCLIHHVLLPMFVDHQVLLMFTVFYPHLLSLEFP